jgi:S1-C subfamily serine protease
VRAARASVVRVVGTACGRGMSGSGWIAGRAIVVTNAHVVAGQDDTQVQPRGEGGLLDAVAVAIDTRNDVAVLRVPGLDGRRLRMAGSATAGAPAAVLGFPGDGPYRVRAARLGATRTVLARERSDTSTVRRSITLFRATVRPGNSGGPLVDRAGRVAGTVFGARSERNSRTGFAVPNEPVRRTLSAAGGPVDTGPCVGGHG